MKQFELGQEEIKFPKRKLPKPKMTIQQVGTNLDLPKSGKKKKGNGRRYYLKEMREAKRGYGRLT